LRGQNDPQYSFTNESSSARKKSTSRRAVEESGDGLLAFKVARIAMPLQQNRGMNGEKNDIKKEEGLHQPT